VAARLERDVERRAARRRPGASQRHDLGVRPEHIQLAFESGVRAAVHNIEYLGGDSLVSCAIGGQPLAVRVPGSVGLAPGDAVWLRWAPGAAHYFDVGGMRAHGAPREAPSTLIA
jgi:ABC-type sugar transport system ATPase subunit